MASLLGIGDDQEQPPGGLLGPLRIEPPDSGQPTLADAADTWGQMIAAQRAKSAQMGMWDDQTGLPTHAGATDAAQKVAQALIFGTFGGQAAKTADLAKLSEASGMAARGVGRDDILAQTGWFKGPDGQWRFEINDAGMTVNPRTADETTLGAAINHPELFAAYPQLADTRVAMGWNTGGSFRPGEPPTISVGVGKPQEGVFLHEIQHNVQDVEGFEQGGSPKTAPARPEFPSLLRRQISKVTTPLSYEDYANAAWGGERSAESLADYNNSYLKTVPKSVDLYSDLGKTIQESVSRDIYKRLFGEVEARASASRMSMNPEARRAAGPWWGDWDVPENQFIKRRGVP